MIVVILVLFSVISLKNDYSFDVSAVSLLPSSGIQNDGEMIQKCALLNRDTGLEFPGCWLAVLYHTTHAH